MRCPPLVCSALAIGTVVCFGSDAHARERPVFCDPPTVTVVARGAIVGGRLCNGPWGCRCAHWFCPQCSTLPTGPVSCPPSPLSCATGPLSCEWTTCAYAEAEGLSLLLKAGVACENPEFSQEGPR